MNRERAKQQLNCIQEKNRKGFKYRRKEATKFVAIVVGCYMKNSIFEWK